MTPEVVSVIMAVRWRGLLQTIVAGLRPFTVAETLQGGCRSVYSAALIRSDTAR